MKKSTPKAPAILEQLRAHPPVPVYLFFGEEDLIVEEAVDAVINTNLTADQKGFNLDNLRAGDLDVRQILAIASAFPMMAERRVVVVRGVDRFTDKELSILLDHLQHPPPTTALILVAERVDRRKKLCTIVERVGFVGEFRVLYDEGLHPWIKAHVASRGGTISPEASKRLVAYAGPALRSIRNEIDKLFTFLGTRTSISEDDVSAVVGLSREFSVFELQRAIGKKELPRATEILERMINAGENVPLIVVMLTSNFVTLWKVRELKRLEASDEKIASECRIPKTFVREYREAADRFSRDEIEQGFLLLADADEKIKSTQLDSRHIMHELLLRLLATGQPANA